MACYLLDAVRYTADGERQPAMTSGARKAWQNSTRQKIISWPVSCFSQITMDACVQTIPAAVRSAHGRVVEQTAAELSSFELGLDPSLSGASVI